MKRFLPYQPYQRQQFLQSIAIVSGIAVIAVLSIPGIRQNADVISRLRQKSVELNTDVELQKITQQALLMRSSIADDRLRNFCLIPVYPYGRAPSITEGQLIVDPVNNRPLAQGTVVCDTEGRTGVIGVDGRVQDVAISINPERFKLVQTNLQARGLKIDPGNPGIRPGTPTELPNDW
jgi:hypothetical protein